MVSEPSEDRVEAWTCHVLATIAQVGKGGTGRSLSIRLTLGFLVLAFGLGLPDRRGASALTLATLTSVMLTHELPRAALAHAFGRSSQIVISVFGGHTRVFGPCLRGARLVAYLTVGSLTNGCVAVAAAAGHRYVGASADASLLAAVAFCHAIWGGAQLLPLVPLHVGAVVAARLMPSARFVHAVASAVVVVAMAAILLISTRAPLLFLSPFAFMAMAMAIAVRDAYRERCDAHSGTSAAASRAEAALWAGEPRRAAALATEALAHVRSTGGRTRLLKALAWAEIAEQNANRAHFWLVRLPIDAIDLKLLASYLTVCGRIEEAVALLERARSLGHRSPEATKVLTDLLLRRGRHGAALALARADRSLLSGEEFRSIETAVTYATSAS